jgi:hypothetical protein
LSSIQSDAALTIDSEIPKLFNFESFTAITRLEVIKAINCLKPGKSPDYDFVSAKMVKDQSSVFIDAIFDIINVIDNKVHSQDLGLREQPPSSTRKRVKESS